MPDRAGYGGSDYDPSGTIASGARDLGELMRHLDLVACPVVGLSGGGPTALACGVVLPDRVTAVATAGGVTTARATAHDFWLFARRWDVEIADVTVPAHIWHGTADRNVPVAHARVIAARCPTARLHIVEGGGHMLLSHLDQIIASLAPPAA